MEHFLCPTLKEGQIVVMDNLQVHKSSRVRELIEDRGASVLFLPPYLSRTSRPLRKRSRRSRPSCAGSRLAPSGPWWKRLGGRSVRLVVRMLWVGSPTAATRARVTHYDNCSRTAAPLGAESKAPEAISASSAASRPMPVEAGY